jgi:hypothetical protein
MASLQDLTVSVTVDVDDAATALRCIAEASDPESRVVQGTSQDRLAAVNRLAVEALSKVKVGAADDKMADALAHERQRCAAILRKMYRHYDGHAIAEAIIEGKAP